jgi:glycerol-3-phosphate O-acyltransferase/dihydroxyacetone phosphate acyltransferase
MVKTLKNVRDIRARLAVCIVVIFLCIREFNPVEVISDVLQFKDLRFYVAVIAAGFAINLCYANARDLAYYMVKVFFTSILNIFFSSIEVLGKENIPQHGPIIFTGNHMNQFVDGAVVLVTCPHKINFLIAESSFRKPVVGEFARLIGALPVYRPIDNAKKGPGKIYFDQDMMFGENTTFSKIDSRDRLRPQGGANEYKIVEVISDTKARLGIVKGDANPLDDNICQGAGKWTEYDILGFVDQSATFGQVNEKLSAGENLIIFPEGGSHDNSDLRPLKSGLASIAFGTLQASDVNVTIVPVGLNYFRGHRFRGRVVVEFGEPIRITKPLVQEFKHSKRDAYQTLMTQVETGMRSVIVTAPSYDQLTPMHTARRLYQRAPGQTTKEKQELARRFSMAFRILKSKYGKRIPNDLVELEKKLVDYQETLAQWGIYDYQVPTLTVPYSRLWYTFAHGLLVGIITCIPSIILNFPVGILAGQYAKRERRIALAKSRVKIDARDVVLTKKIVFSIVGVPVLWVFYAILLYHFSGWEFKTVMVCFLCCPAFSYVGIRSAEAGMVDLKDLRPMFLRILPGWAQQHKKIADQRNLLVKEVRTMVKKYGPDMGSLYFDKSPNWEETMSVLSKSASQQLLEDLVVENNVTKDSDENDTTETEEEIDPLSVDNASREGERVPSGLGNIGSVKNGNKKTN